MLRFESSIAFRWNHRSTVHLHLWFPLVLSEFSLVKLWNFFVIFTNFPFELSFFSLFSRIFASISIFNWISLNSFFNCAFFFMIWPQIRWIFSFKIVKFCVNFANFLFQMLFCFADAFSSSFVLHSLIFYCNEFGRSSDFSFFKCFSSIWLGWNKKIFRSFFHFG